MREQGPSGAGLEELPRESPRRIEEAGVGKSPSLSDLVQDNFSSIPASAVRWISKLYLISASASGDVTAVSVSSSRKARVRVELSSEYLCCPRLQKRDRERWAGSDVGAFAPRNRQGKSVKVYPTKFSYVILLCLKSGLIPLYVQICSFGSPWCRYDCPDPTCRAIAQSDLAAEPFVDPGLVV